MRRGGAGEGALLLSLLGVVVSLVAATPARAALEEPVTVTATAPPTVAVGAPFRLEVAVAAEAGALDIAAQPLRVRVRAAPECGGSFAGTEGPTLFDRTLPAPAAGARYEQTLAVSAKLGEVGTETICAFLEDAQERQFATDTEGEVTVVPGCGVSNRQLRAVNRKLRATRHRLVRLRHELRHAEGARRRSLRRRQRRLQRRLHLLLQSKAKAIQATKLACASATRAAASASAAEVPHIKHFFVIVLENENAESSFGKEPASPYLGKTLRSEGAFLPNYYGIGHQSLDNYIAMVSGQPPNLATQADCLLYANMLTASVREDGVAVGQGCVYPTTVETVANQLEDSGHTWHGYMEDMASGAPGDATSCRHPEIGSADQTQQARATDQYAARHDPFVYFHSIIDYATCQRNVVDLKQLPHDLAGAATTPEYSFITPDLCADGHESSCPDGSPGGFEGIEAFLREWVPRIQASPAYRDHGAILVTFDESASGAESCCGEQNGPNTPNNGGVSLGSGGGRVGAVMLSPCIEPGTVSDTPYNHYSMLRWVEDDFGLSHLADAGTEGLVPFGADVFNRPSCPSGEPEGGGGGGATVRLQARPRRAAAGRRTQFRFRLLGPASCREGAVVRFAGHRRRLDDRGLGRIRLRFGSPGKRVAKLSSPACGQASAVVRVE